MTWARFDDGFVQHPKIVGLSDGAFRLHVAAVCYAARNLTDGKIRAAALPTLRPRGAQRFTAELVAAGVWDTTAGPEYVIHDYLDYNPSAEQVNSKRDSKAMAGAKGAASRWHDGRNAPVPVPSRPLPDLTTTPTTRARDSAGWYEATMGKPPHNDGLRGVLAGIDHAHPQACRDWAFGKAASADDPWPYAKRLFDNCEAGLLEGHGPREKPHGTNGVGNRASGAGGRRTQPTQPRSGPDMAGWERVLRNE